MKKQNQQHQKQVDQFMSKSLRCLNPIIKSSLFGNQTTTNDLEQQAAVGSNSMLLLNWPQTRRQLSLLFVASILIVISTSNSVQAEHALSEVWSESDGLQMKYSTDHEDLLSTKGSELQLNVHDKPNEASTGSTGEELAATSGGATNQEGSSSSNSESGEGSSGPPASSDHASDGTSGQSSSSSGRGDDNESPSVPSNEESSDQGSSSSSSGEENSDSTSSPTNRVPFSKHQSSGNNLRSQQQTKFNEPSARFKASQHDQASSINDNDEDARATRFKPESDHTNFNSIPSGQSYSAINDDNGIPVSPQVNTDNSDLPSQASHEISAGKAFRQVGRMFKEAIKMTSSPEKAQTKSKVGSKKNDNEVNNEENEENEDDNKSSPHPGSQSEENKRQQKQQQEQQDDEEPSTGQEPDYNLLKSSGNSKMVSARARQNMIDFDRMVDNKQGQPMMTNQHTAFQQQGELNDEIASVDGGEEHSPVGNSNDDYRRSLGHNNRAIPQIGRQQLQQLMNSPPDEFGMFPTDPNVNSNPFFAAGSSHEKKERIAPGKSKQAVEGGVKRPNKPLSYFRGVSQQQKQASEEARRGQVRQASQQQPESPDSVRDNFISPGHFPGSMPHLTQAASETQKKEAEVPVSVAQPVVAASSTSTTTTTTETETASPTVAQEAVVTTTSDRSSSVKTTQAGPPISDPTISVASTQSVSTISAENAESSQKQQQYNSSDTSNSAKKQGDIIGAGNRADPSPSSDLKERDFQAHVTPVPESQPESQQIMAPVYFSTTTMAPLPATGSSIKTSEAPTLKRFKFRKYRR